MEESARNSTSYGTDGLFAEMSQRASNGELGDAVAQRATTSEMNLGIEEAFFGAEQARDPGVVPLRVWGGVRRVGQCVPRPEVVEQAVAGGHVLLPEQAAGWVAGLDPAFASDAFGLALVGRQGRRLVLGRVQAWTPKRRWLRRTESFEERREVEDELLAEVAEVIRPYGARCVTDQYAAPQVVARLAGSACRCNP